MPFLGLIIPFAVAALAPTIAGLLFLLLRRRTPAPTSPITNPASVAVPPAAAIPVPPPISYPFEDEWEAHASYPEHAWRTTAPFIRPSRPEHPHLAREAFAFEDVDDYRFETASMPSFKTEPDVAKRMANYPFGPSESTLQEITSDTTLHCPNCRSSRIETLNVARKAGGTIGSVAGATSGMAMAFSGAEAGAVVGAVGGPIGSIFGGLAGAVIAGLVGSAAGCAAGSAVGAAIDDNLLENFRCRSCGHSFGAHQA
ncbi:hypothetical protein [Paraburkholderia caribensis]|uniref:hypothetical protein n=1 Tax=Paraburkholderia caribensis TaxID=75105 RepID=UPI000A88A884|nr:hypothetical protein [Paraburkholderia caribensis]